MNDRIREQQRLAFKLFVRYPLRLDGKVNVHNKLISACWDLTDEQIEKVVEFAKGLNNDL